MQRETKAVACSWSVCRDGGSVHLELTAGVAEAPRGRRPGRRRVGAGGARRRRWRWQPLLSPWGVKPRGICRHGFVGSGPTRELLAWLWYLESPLSWRQLSPSSGKSSVFHEVPASPLSWPQAGVPFTLFLQTSAPRRPQPTLPLICDQLPAGVTAERFSGWQCLMKNRWTCWATLGRKGRRMANSVTGHQRLATCHHRRQPPPPPRRR